MQSFLGFLIHSCSFEIMIDFNLWVCSAAVAIPDYGLKSLNASGFTGSGMFTEVLPLNFLGCFFSVFSK